MIRAFISSSDGFAVAIYMGLRVALDRVRAYFSAYAVFPERAPPRTREIVFLCICFCSMIGSHFGVIIHMILILLTVLI